MDQKWRTWDMNQRTQGLPTTVNVSTIPQCQLQANFTFFVSVTESHSTCILSSLNSYVTEHNNTHSGSHIVNTLT